MPPCRFLEGLEPVYPVVVPTKIGMTDVQLLSIARNQVVLTLSNELRLFYQTELMLQQRQLKNVVPTKRTGMHLDNPNIQCDRSVLGIYNIYGKN